jgi:hypothetical protein
MDESLWSMIRTELDLSLGTSAGFASAEAAKTLNRAPASATTEVHRVDLINAIAILVGWFYFKLCR